MHVLGPIGTAWALVAAVEFFRFQIAMLWVFAPAIYAGVYAVAVLVTLVTAIGAWRRRGPA